ncbi:MAG: MBL fold metallo-hydrolase [Coriobacteriia bacterium]|nr:MBL fold metallo-hydrolase [Coriobacteriia bacterium]
MTRMLYQGHGSYRFTLNDGTVVYVDPFAGEGYDLPANLILVTHEHPDHTCVDKMPHAKNCTILRAADFLANGDHQTLKSHGLTMQAVLADNENHPPKECVGLVLDMDDLRFYASGDTSVTDDMRSGKLAAMGLDYAVFPCDGFYNMGPDEASRAAALVKARHSIPVHLVPVHDVGNPTIFSRSTAEAFQADGRIILEPGEELEL